MGRVGMGGKEAERSEGDMPEFWWYSKAYLFSCTSSYVELYRDGKITPFSAVSIPRDL